MLLVPSVQVATLALGVAVLIFNLTSGFVSSSLQSVLSTPIRGMGVAMLMLAVNLIGGGGGGGGAGGGGGGGGAGPLLEGMMSDYLVPLCGADGLRYSLVAGIGGAYTFGFRRITIAKSSYHEYCHGNK